MTQTVITRKDLLVRMETPRFLQDKDEITIFDINGSKVSNRDKITIEKLTPSSGYLNWDCSDMQSGTYLIQIKHGTRSNTLKIMINR